MSRGEPPARILDFGDDTGAVESHVSDPRREVDTTEPELIRTLHTVGYVLREPQPSRA
ncbi:hypothetical protein [Nocardia nepalensis]|uniref:hypothetical protein n=1 Tax=Nocardia nepalensis TaxID=3375448 RepID=UPI003B67D120